MSNWAFSSNITNCSTPDDLFKLLDSEFHFTLDVCANEYNFKVKKYFDEKTNGIAQSWKDNICWMNPPYGRQLPIWIEKAWLEKMINKVLTVALVPCRPDTNWFWKWCINEEIRLIKGRLRFKYGLWDGTPKEHSFGAPFPSMIVVFKP